MRTIISSILLLILLSFTSPAPSELAKRIGRILIEIIELKKEYELRKLQSTDSTDDEVNYIEPSTNNTKAYLQFLDFNGFTQGSPSNGKTPFSFNTLFYFLGIPIPDVIYVPLKVILGSSGQNGEQEILATCKPKDEIIPEADEQNGRTKQFKCEAFALGEGNISSVSYDFSKKVKTETNGTLTSYSGEDIFFGESANSLKDKIHTANIPFTDLYILKNGKVENTNKNDGKFNVNGTLDKEIDPINKQFLDLVINSNKNLTCQISGTQENSVLSCDTNKQPLDKTNLDGKYGIVSVDKNIYKVFLLMKSDNATIDEGDYDSSLSGAHNFSKSSSGLSGGAIAGIVIACVVALIAIALAIIMLRKPQNTKHLDNTTVSGLKTVENL